MNLGWVEDTQVSFYTQKTRKLTCKPCRALYTIDPAYENGARRFNALAQFTDCLEDIWDFNASPMKTKEGDLPDPSGDKLINFMSGRLHSLLGHNLFALTNSLVASLTGSVTFEGGLTGAHFLTSLVNGTEYGAMSVTTELFSAPDGQ